MTEACGWRSHVSGTTKPADEAGRRQSLPAESIMGPGRLSKVLWGILSSRFHGEGISLQYTGTMASRPDGAQLESNSLKKFVDCQVGVDWSDDVLLLNFEEVEDEREGGEVHEAMQATSKAVVGRGGNI
ncbi:hypothetical protein NDU88_002007 [Pleurodeles waltl]|uniref:PB1 domain-containing protein n=1 Tax=Pleurodeles waltl TaxID=8319 RepID=A0AAV7SBA0_PLEWA|nr:hypothetical protein NDU88_002007 [Pleurodeles waltl]